VAVVDRTGPPLEDEQTRGIPIGERLLRDQFGREAKVEVLGLQNSFF
jgi:hypothetical protein